MSEELKRYVEDALYKWIVKQIEEGKFRANLRIEIDTPIEVRGMKGRVVGEILLSEEKSTTPQVSLPAKAPEEKKSSAEGEEMSLQEVEKLLKSLGV